MGGSGLGEERGREPKADAHALMDDEKRNTLIERALQDFILFFSK